MNFVLSKPISSSTAKIIVKKLLLGKVASSYIIGEDYADKLPQWRALSIPALTCLHLLYICARTFCSFSWCDSPTPPFADNVLTSVSLNTEVAVFTSQCRPCAGIREDVQEVYKVVSRYSSCRAMIEIIFVFLKATKRTTTNLKGQAYFSACYNNYDNHYCRLLTSLLPQQQQR